MKRLEHDSNNTGGSGSLQNYWSSTSSKITVVPEMHGMPQLEERFMLEIYKLQPGATYIILDHVLRSARDVKELEYMEKDCRVRLQGADDCSYYYLEMSRFLKFKAMRPGKDLRFTLMYQGCGIAVLDLHYRLALQNVRIVEQLKNFQEKGFIRPSPFTNGEHRARLSRSERRTMEVPEDDLELLQKRSCLCQIFKVVNFGLQEVTVLRDSGLARVTTNGLLRFLNDRQPITLLDQKNKTYVWGDKQDEAFQILKEKLCNAPVLALPDGPDDFVVYCDASKQDIFVGAVALSRKKDSSPGRLFQEAIGYKMKCVRITTLRPNGQNYCVRTYPNAAGVMLRALGENVESPFYGLKLEKVAYWPGQIVQETKLKDFSNQGKIKRRLGVPEKLC
ncbi:putative reverse transcriptase domain-containing protein [Tanacetum coccineum]